MSLSLAPRASLLGRYLEEGIAKVDRRSSYHSEHNKDVSNDRHAVGMCSSTNGYLKRQVCVYAMLQTPCNPSIHASRSIAIDLQCTLPSQDILSQTFLEDWIIMLYKFPPESDRAEAWATRTAISDAKRECVVVV